MTMKPFYPVTGDILANCNGILKVSEGQKPDPDVSEMIRYEARSFNPINNYIDMFVFPLPMSPSPRVFDELVKTITYDQMLDIVLKRIGNDIAYMGNLNALNQRHDENHLLDSYTLTIQNERVRLSQFQMPGWHSDFDDDEPFIIDFAIGMHKHIEITLIPHIGRLALWKPSYLLTANTISGGWLWMGLLDRSTIASPISLPTTNTNMFN